MRNIFLSQDQIQSFSKPENRLEPEFEDVYQRWKEKPDDTARTSEILSALSPMIERNVNTISSGDAANLNMQGKLLALKALHRYDPSKASMSTYLTQQLMPLRRTARQEMNILGVPDRLMVANQKVQEAETEFEYENGRSPTLQELSDKLKISRKQLLRLRNSGHAQNSGTYLTAEEESGPDSPETVRRLNDEYVDQYVLSGLDEVSALIYKHDNAMKGYRRLSTDALAAKLKMSPAAVSHRRNKIAQLANTAERAIYG